ncbi:MAG TPA: hypothetical protein VFC16_17115 [Nakamurella sp.]|nr:hypothetical protein [Nakamurella sp.]
MAALLAQVQPGDPGAFGGDRVGDGVQDVEAAAAHQDQEGHP